MHGRLLHGVVSTSCRLQVCGAVPNRLPLTTNSPLLQAKCKGIVVAEAIALLPFSLLLHLYT